MKDIVITYLLYSLNQIALGLRKHPDISQLPPASWLVSPYLLESSIGIDILLNTDLLIQHGFVGICDPTDWLWLIVPTTAKMVTARASDLSGSFKLIFTIRSENRLWRSSATVSELIEPVRDGRIDDFGSMMASLKHDNEMTPPST